MDETRRILQELNQSLSEVKKETTQLVNDDKYLSAHISVSNDKKKNQQPLDKLSSSTSAWAKSSTVRGSGLPG